MEKTYANHRSEATSEATVDWSNFSASTLEKGSPKFDALAREALNACQNDRTQRPLAGYLVDSNGARLFLTIPHGSEKADYSPLLQKGPFVKCEQKQTEEIRPWLLITLDTKRESLLLAQPTVQSKL